ncbi:MAG: hypothetical protein HQL20_08295 [Candidatus Omnitrophica bacterium]|nr:hypothetical protein [Candidatus Omnitrophota bacterium]
MIINLSPFEKNRIIPDNFGSTEMGRDLLAQDYLLKQITASLTNPDTDLGKKFWDGVYEHAYQRFGTTDIPTDTISKVWITPDKAVVYEKGNTVYVLEHHLKVMMESDYYAMKAAVNNGPAMEDNEEIRISKQVMREVIIPAIEKEVNEGRSFAPVRQMYSGMLLATWYKLALKESILGRLYADQNRTKGVDQDPENNQKIFRQYVEAFNKGVFNMIKEDVDRYSQEIIPRKYFSGGCDKAGYAGPDGILGTSDDGLTRKTNDANSEALARGESGDLDFAAVEVRNSRALTASDMSEGESDLDNSQDLTRTEQNRQALGKAFSAWLRGKVEFPINQFVFPGAQTSVVYALSRTQGVIWTTVKPSFSAQRFWLVKLGEDKFLLPRPLSPERFEALGADGTVLWVEQSPSRATIVPIKLDTYGGDLIVDAEYEAQIKNAISNAKAQPAVVVPTVSDAQPVKNAGLPTNVSATSIPVGNPEAAIKEINPEKYNEHVKALGTIFTQWLRTSIQEYLLKDLTRVLKERFPDAKVSIVYRWGGAYELYWSRERESNPQQYFLVETEYGLFLFPRPLTKERFMDPGRVGRLWRDGDKELIEPGQAKLVMPIRVVGSNRLEVEANELKVDGGRFDMAGAVVENGGIDFAQASLNMQIRRDGNGVPLPVSQQNLDSIRINGLVPVILSIQSGANVKMFPAVP